MVFTGFGVSQSIQRLLQNKVEKYKIMATMLLTVIIAC